MVPMVIKGGTPTVLIAQALVGQSTENRQHKHRQNVIQSHNDTGPGLAHAELVGEDHGDGGVVGLPEGADEEKGKAYQDGAFVIKLHWDTSKI